MDRHKQTDRHTATANTALASTARVKMAQNELTGSKTSWKFCTYKHIYEQITISTAAAAAATTTT